MEHAHLSVASMHLLQTDGDIRVLGIQIFRAPTSLPQQNVATVSQFAIVGFIGQNAGVTGQEAATAGERTRDQALSLARAAISVFSSFFL